MNASSDGHGFNKLTESELVQFYSSLGGYSKTLFLEHISNGNTTFKVFLTPAVSYAYPFTIESENYYETPRMYFDDHSFISELYHYDLSKPEFKVGVFSTDVDTTRLEELVKFAEEL